MPETIRLDNVSRIEGHGRVSLVVDAEGRVTDAQFNVLEFRGFEKMLEGRMVWEMPLLTSRVCGVCPVSHHVAAVKAVDALLGVEIPPAAVTLRRLLQLAGFVHDHALHFFFLAGPDFLVGDGGSRDLLGVIEAQPEMARRAIALRKSGQRIVDAVGGQASHPVTAIPGGMSRPLADETRLALLAEAGQALESARAAERVARESTLRLLAEHPGFAADPTPLLAQMGPGRTFDVYDGEIVVAAADGGVYDTFDAERFFEKVGERTLPWTYAKAPYLADLGPDLGAYRVGPLARMNLAASTGGAIGDALLVEFRAELGEVVHDALAYHWARMIELVAACEAIVRILADPSTSSPDVRVKVARAGGVGAAAVEAPRGTLVHRYEADDVGRVTKAELVVATTQNSLAINAAVLSAVRGAVTTGGKLDDATRRRMELGIRAYDPCLSCATHEVGRMPFSVEVIDGTAEDGDASWA
jgi:NAD-reducing hydrogenase large subunit